MSPFIEILLELFEKSFYRLAGNRTESVLLHRASTLSGYQASDRFFLWVGRKAGNVLMPRNRRGSEAPGPVKKENYLG